MTVVIEAELVSFTWRSTGLIFSMETGLYRLICPSISKSWCFSFFVSSDVLEPYIFWCFMSISEKVSVVHWYRAILSTYLNSKYSALTLGTAALASIDDRNLRLED